MWDGPFPDRSSFDEELAVKARSEDPLFSAYIDNATGCAVGLGSFMRIDEKNRVIEVGSLMFGRAMQRTRVSTEAMYLMAKYVFEELRYRRYEWKCNALNGPSRQAALRLGFTFEGIFRQHMIVKEKNRDTAWFAMLDGEWPARKAEFECWLDPANFDEAGVQKTRLAQSS
jgi:RimJ/RimL family protein N-acetyltransferase